MKIEKINGFYVPINDQHFNQWAQGQSFTQNTCLKKFLIWCDSQQKRFNTVIDIGAWCGTWSSELVKYSKKIYAFEPSRIHFHCLEKNIFNIADKVEPNSIAIGDKEAWIDLIETDHTQEARVDDSKTGKIQMRTLDSFNYENVDLIKIDVEGYEMRVLHGAEKTLEKCQYLMIELNNNSKKYGSSNNDIESYLASKGWQVLIDHWPDKVFCK